MIEESIIGREIFTSWLKGPEDAIRQKEKRRRRKNRRQIQNGVEATQEGEDHHRSSVAVTEQTDAMSEKSSIQPRRDGDPQGFIYGKFKLDKNMIVSLCWEGLRVEYFLDVEVRYGAEVLACRAALDIYDSVE